MALSLAAPFARACDDTLPESFRVWGLPCFILSLDFSVIGWEILLLIVSVPWIYEEACKSFGRLSLEIEISKCIDSSAGCWILGVACSSRLKGAGFTLSSSSPLQRIAVLPICKRDAAAMA